MYYKSKSVSLLILAVFALLLSRATFAFMDDPEGPNLLVVFLLAGIVYIPTLVAYYSLLKGTGFKRILSAMIIEALILFVLYFLLA